MLRLGFPDAGWSSPVARWAHNPKVAGSNPAPAQLKHENARLRALADRLESDPTTIESVARENLGLVRDGEILVVVTDVKPTTK